MSRNEQEMKDLLRALTLCAGAPGAEDEVRALIRENLEGVGELSYDGLGSILCERSGGADSPRVLIDGHMDEVGFMVQSITKEGLVNFVPLGGWWAHVLLSQRVDIITSGGKVQNVTTGASLWLAGAVGLGCGAGQMPLAAMASVIVLVVLFALRQIEKWMGTH